MTRIPRLWTSLALAAALAAQEPQPTTRGAGADTLPPGLDLAEMTRLPPLVVDNPTPDTTRVVGRGYKAEVTAAGLQFCAIPGPTLPLAPVTLQLRHVRIDGSELPLRTHKRVDQAETCVLDHGALEEHLELQPRGIEQSFHFATLPSRGELTVHLAVTTELTATPNEGGVLFGSGLHSVHYGSAVAIDARGKRIAMASEWVEGGVQIRVPREFVAAAELPLIIDPFLWAPKTWVLGTGTGGNLRIMSPDLAYGSLSGTWLLVWQVYSAANDNDVYARRFDVDWNARGSAQSVDVSTNNWWTPSVAWVAGAVQWHVTAYQWDIGPVLQSVMLRRMGVVGPVGAAVRVGLRGASLFDNQTDFGPVIGGTPATGSDAVSLVVWSAFRDLAPTRAIEYAVVGREGAGSAVREVPIGGRVRDGAVSKANRGDRWLLAWAEENATPATTLNLRALLFDRLGNVVSGRPLVLGSVPFDPTVPTSTNLSVSAPDVNGNFTVAWSDRAALDTKLRRVSRTGVMTAAVSMNSLFIAWGNAPTDIETDGQRILAVSGNGSFVHVGLFAFDAATARWRIDDETLASAPLRVVQAAVSSRYVGGLDSAPTPFSLAYQFADSRLSGIRVVDYEPPVTGSAVGSGYSMVPTGCGTELSLTAEGTPPTPGSTLRFTLASDVGMTGLIVGLPAYLPLSGLCSCTLGVEGHAVLGSHLVLSVPPQSSLIGATLAVQGLTWASGPCLGHISLSDTMHVRIQ